MRLRTAAAEEIGVAQKLRAQMLAEVAGALPEDLPAAIGEYLKTHIGDGSCLCALLENEEGPIATAMLCMYEVMPDERNLSGRCAALFSLPEF